MVFTMKNQVISFAIITEDTGADICILPPNPMNLDMASISLLWSREG